jgi:hypothetical protein
MEKVKYFYNPAYTSAEWESRGADGQYLKKGQIGFELDTFSGLVTSMRIGPGNWNDLEKLGVESYIYSNAVTNPIGDVKLGDVLEGQAISQIIRNMVSPFLVPVMINATNDADGSLGTTSILEVGNTLSTTVNINYVLNNPQNLKLTNNIFISSGIFNEDGFLNHTGASLPMTLINPLAAPTNPAGQITYPITVKGLYDGGETGTVTTNIAFYGAVIWGYLPTDDHFDVVQTYNNPFAVGDRKVASSYNATYSMVGTGYAYMCIPAMQSPSNVTFLEVTNPLQPSNYSMIYVGTRTINNGTTSYSYEIWRSEFSIIANTKMKVE